MRRYWQTLFLILLSFFKPLNAFSQSIPEVHAHRGFRGLMPENTIVAMKNALDLKAAFLELDVCFSKDKKAIVWHDPWLDPDITLGKEGEALSRDKKPALYQMDYHDIRRYDVGSLPNAKFPLKQNIKAYIPLLSELIDSVEIYSGQKGYPKPRYTIETKTSPSRDEIFLPAPEEFVKRLMTVIYEKNIQDRVIIQSFDPRTLELIRRQHPKIALMLLTTKGSFEANMSKLTFLPDYYSPAVKLINSELVALCEKKGVKLVGGNINSKKEIERILKLGVRSFISDFPH